MFRSETQFVAKKDMMEDRTTNLVGVIVERIKNKQFDAIEDCSARQCFQCLIAQPKHTTHCSQCQVCVQYRSFHSVLLGRCVSGGNAREYFFMILSLFITTCLFYVSILETMHLDTEHTMVFRVPCQLLCLLDHSRILFALVCLPVVPLTCWAMDLVWMAVAASRKLTVKELKSPHKFKYLFQIKEYQGDTYFVHKSLPYRAMARNLWRFLKGKDKGTRLSRENFKAQVYATSAESQRSN